MEGWGNVCLNILCFYTSTDLHITIVQRLKTASVQEGESCAFDCHLSHNVDDPPSWTINGHLVVSNNRIQMINNGHKYRLTIKDAMLADAGDVVFTIKDLNCRTILFVKGEYLSVVYIYKKRRTTKVILSVMHFPSIRKTSTHLQGPVEHQGSAR